MNTEREPRKYRYIHYTILLESHRIGFSKKFKKLIFETAPEQSGHLHISQLSIIGSSRKRERKSVEVDIYYIQSGLEVRVKCREREFERE